LSVLVGGALLAAACGTGPGAAPVAPVQAPARPALPTATGQNQPSGTVITEGADPSAGVVFHVLPDQSQARFLIDEILAGSPKVVVGATSEVSGEIVGDFASPEGVAVGPIQVDMSALRTDNNFRNRAIHDAILQTGDEANRYAVFQVTGVEGLPSEVAFGTPYELTLNGDLTIHGVTRNVTFSATVTPVSETRLEGAASASMPFSDFGIQILRLPPQVASVGDTVTLEIDFVAEAD
jgi:polyisoprenoid-binding protein YceI